MIWYLSVKSVKGYGTKMAIHAMMAIITLFITNFFIIETTL